MTPVTGLQLRSLVKPDGELEITLVDRSFPAPADDEVLVRIEATPINPSDLGLLFGPADLATVSVSGTPERPVVTARIPERAMGALAARVGNALPCARRTLTIPLIPGACVAPHSQCFPCGRANARWHSFGLCFMRCASAWGQSSFLVLLGGSCCASGG